ncbi:MAG: SIMPL domain-containing protein [Thermodesulfovibrio sp.]|nr:SIMPL domain-containing protein [Thermodesulfovibrio sp.]
MKKFFSLFTIIVFINFSLLYAEDKTKEYELTRISITLEEKKELSPDILNINFSVTAKAQKESDVINILGTIDKSLRNLKIDYTGGNYSVYKNCWWEKNKWKCSGYKGDLSYVFRLKETKEQNRILESVEEIKENFGENMAYTLSNPQWIITEKKYKEIENTLKIEIIDTAINFAKKVSDKIGRQCFISNIDYDIKRFYLETPTVYKSALPAMAMERTIEAPEPKKEDKTVTVKAYIKYLCIEKK